MAKYRIKLTRDEVSELSSIIKKGSHSSQTYIAAYILLNCDEGEYAAGKSTNEQICSILKTGMRTIDCIKRKCVEVGIDNALERSESTRIYSKKIDGDLEARTVQLCCSEPPEGFAKWTVRLLAGKVVEPGYIDYISHVSVHHTLKKTNLSRGK
jgi:5-deoxy-D-glucuronate isomerase